MRIIFVLVLLGLCAVRFADAQRNKPEAGLSDDCSRRSRLEDEQKFAEFVIRIYRGDDYFGGCIQVLKNDQIVFSRHTEGKFVIGNDVNKNDVSADGMFHPPAIAIGTDITGLGKPNLILSEWSGGVHCCFTFHVLELGEHPERSQPSRQKIRTMPTSRM